MDNQQQSTQPRPLWGLIILLALGAIFVVVLMMLRRPATPPPVSETLPVLGTVPQFQLTEASGKPVTLDSLRGRLWVADFIFTTCGGTCPMMTSTLYQVNHDLDPALGVQLVSFSVDPEHDTPDVLAAYADNNQLPRAHWYFLTGERAAIYSLALRGFHLPVSDSGETEKLITHSSKLALVDRMGHIRGYYEGTDSTAVPDLHRDIAILSRETTGDSK